MDASIRERVLQLNPWQARPDRWSDEVARRLPEHFVPRRVDARETERRDRASLIVGPRQAGKSTLAWRLLRDEQPGEVLFLSAEEERVRHWAQSPTGVLSDLEREFPAVRTIFIEEAQNLEEAGLFVKGLVDARRGLRVLVTGSSSFHLEARTRESLAGRASRFRLLPLSLDEILDGEGATVPAVRAQRGREVARRIMARGGYPAVWFAEDPERELRELIEAFVVRDASDRFRIRHPEAFRQLLELAAGQVGQMLNLNEWAGILGIARSTVDDYLGLLEETWIVQRLRPFAGGRRREITGARRIHFYDPGLRNVLVGHVDDAIERRADRGALLEAFAFAELAKNLPPGARIHYWRARGGAEVDLVVARGDRLLPIEVKSRDPGRPTRSMRSFVSAYEPELGLVACHRVEATREDRVGRTTLRSLPIEHVAATVWDAFEPTGDGHE